MIDMSLEQWEQHLLTAGGHIGKDLLPVVKKAAVNVKKGWASRISGVEGGSVSRAHMTIAFDEPVVSPGGHSVSAEVSPHERYRGSGRQRGVAVVLEFGTAYTPARLFGQYALAAEATNFERWIIQAAEASLAGDPQ